MKTLEQSYVNSYRRPTRTVGVICALALLILLALCSAGLIGLMYLLKYLFELIF